jgi:hypothetical protein
MMRPMAKKNREERRHEKFGGGRTSERGGWPTIRPNPVFRAPADAAIEPDDAPAPVDAAAPKDAKAGPPDQDEIKATGAGTGGATEQAGRAPRRQGTHAKNAAKG